MQPYVLPRFPPDHVSRFLDTGPWEITGVVDGRPTEFESRTRFAVMAECLTSGAESHRVSGLLRVTVTGPGETSFTVSAKPDEHQLDITAPDPPAKLSELISRPLTGEKVEVEVDRWMRSNGYKLAAPKTWVYDPNGWDST